jgi:hypothetical protein
MSYYANYWLRIRKVNTKVGHGRILGLGEEGEKNSRIKRIDWLTNSRMVSFWSCFHIGKEKC